MKSVTIPAEFPAAGHTREQELTEAGRRAMIAAGENWQMTRRFVAIVLTLIGLAALVLVGVYFYQQRQVDDPQAAPLPAELAGLELTSAVYGSEAVGQINRLHGQEFDLSQGAVGYYGPGGHATLWVAGTPFAFQAPAVLEAMQRSINSGRFPYQPAGQVEVAGVTVEMLQGLNNLHFYFQSGPYVVWIQADPDLAQDLLAEAVAFYR